VRVTFVVPALVLALSQFVPAAPQLPVRDPGGREQSQPVGTAAVRGRVVAMDTGSPIRHASVNLMMMPPPVTATASTAPASAPNPPQPASGGRGTVVQRTRTAVTDAQGVFEFKDLPAGSYRLSASPSQYSAQYLGMTYGAKKPNGPGSSDSGTPIDLSEGQTLDKATIALPRGSVITGHVTDENGDPLARVQVYSLFYQQGSSRGMRFGSSAQTDDLGQYRLYGLAPGDYAIAAEAQRNSFVPPNAPPETEEERVGMMTTFFPNALDETVAQRVRVRQGTQTAGIEIQMVSGRLLHINGMVVDSQGRPPTGRVNGMLAHKTPGGMGGISMGFTTQPDGHFEVRNVAPGDYRIIVRPIAMPRDASGRMDMEPGESASVAVSLTADIDNLLIATTPGITITGQLVFENGPPQIPPSQNGTNGPAAVRVTAQPGDQMNIGMLPMPPPAAVSSDFTFTMKGLAGEYLLRGFAPQQYLKSVQLDGADITDTPHEFKQGDRVTIVMTSRSSTVEGNVTDTNSAPVPDAMVMVFPEDKASWRMNSTHRRLAGTDRQGHYKISGLMAGRYLIIAAPRDRIAVSFPDEGFFENLAKDATPLVVGEDDQRQADLKLVPSPSGGGHE
jgi:protocatechuate 3,4-dioxygenase beta subunit